MKIEEKEFDPIDPKDIKTKPTKKEKQQSKKEIKLIPKDTTELLLVTIFLALLVFTIILGFKAYNLGKERKKEVQANIVVPVLSKSTNNELSIDVGNMAAKEEKEYIFKISNERNGKINQEEIIYSIQFNKDDNIALEVFKNSNDKNLLTNSELKIKDNKLKSQEKQEDTYTVKIKTIAKTKSKQLVTIKVAS